MPIPLRHIPRHELQAAAIALGSGVVLLGMKFAAYLLTGSSAVFSDALEQIVNVLAAGFALYALSLAHRPADDAHPYGHGKIEFVSAGFEGGMMLVAALLIGLRAIESLAYGPELQRIDWGLAIIALATAGNGIVGWRLIRSGRRHGSITLEAGGRHLVSDAVTSIAVLVALGIVWLTGWTYADPIAALIMAVYVASVAGALMRRAAAGLMDEQDAADEQMLRALLDAHVGPAGAEPRICSYHKLRHRHSGRYHWVDFHIMVPAGWDVQRGHEVASAIEHEIELALGEGNATAHVEPCPDAACAACGRNAGAAAT
jgi:cation diffusion facilitator family transporter